MIFENKNLSPNFRLKRFLYRGGLNCKFYPNRFLNLRFLLVGFYCSKNPLLIIITIITIIINFIFYEGNTGQYFN